MFETANVPCSGCYKTGMLGENKSEHTIMDVIEYQIANHKARVHNDIAPSEIRIDLRKRNGNYALQYAVSL